MNPPQTRLLVCLLLAVLLPGCIPVPVHYTPEPQTRELDIPAQQLGDTLVAPYFHRATVYDFSQALQRTDNLIEPVDSKEAFKLVFPEQRQPTEVPLRELLTPEARDALLDHGIDYLIILSAATTRQAEQDGGYVGVGIHGSQVLSTQLRAAVIDLETFDEPASLLSESAGKDSATWLMLPYAGLFIFGSVPDTHEGALQGLASAVAGQIRQQVKDGPVKVTMIVGAWDPQAESAEQP
jgi:hypothetical protein